VSHFSVGARSFAYPASRSLVGYSFLRMQQLAHANPNLCGQILLIVLRVGRIATAELVSKLMITCRALHRVFKQVQFLDPITKAVNSRVRASLHYTACRGACMTLAEEWAYWMRQKPRCEGKSAWKFVGVKHLQLYPFYGRPLDDYSKCPACWTRKRAVASVGSRCVGCAIADFPYDPRCRGCYETNRHALCRACGNYGTIRQPTLKLRREGALLGPDLEARMTKRRRQ
jgi:hypothetical protein